MGIVRPSQFGGVEAQAKMGKRRERQMELLPTLKHTENPESWSRPSVVIESIFIYYMDTFRFPRHTTCIIGN